MKIRRKKEANPLITSPIFLNFIVIFLSLKGLNQEHPEDDIFWILTIVGSFIVWLFINWEIK